MKTCKTTDQHGCWNTRIKLSSCRVPSKLDVLGVFPWRPARIPACPRASFHRQIDTLVDNGEPFIKNDMRNSLFVSFVFVRAAYYHGAYFSSDLKCQGIHLENVCRHHFLHTFSVDVVDVVRSAVRADHTNRRTQAECHTAGGNRRFRLSFVM